jgi:hypothetical protein
MSVNRIAANRRTIAILHKEPASVAQLGCCERYGDLAVASMALVVDRVVMIALSTVCLRVLRVSARPDRGDRVLHR